MNQSYKFGEEIIFFERIDGYSTTNIIQQQASFTNTKLHHQIPVTPGEQITVVVGGACS